MFHGNVLSASNLGQADKCPAMMHLPWPKFTNKYMEEGNLKHRFVQDWINHGREYALETHVSGREDYSPLSVCNLEDLFGGVFDDLISEVSFSWDPKSDTAEEIGQNLDRDYPDQPGQIFGTADIIRAGKDSIFVDDLKTGARPVSQYNNYQLQFLALAAARAYGAKQAYVRLLWMDETGHITTHDYIGLDAYELDQLADKFKALAEDVADGAGDYIFGEHCARCPAFTACPKQVRLPKALAKISGDKITPRTLPKAYSTYMAAKNIVKTMGEVLATAVEQMGPVDLGDGTSLECTPGSRKELSAKPALDTLCKFLGPTAIPDGVSVSKASIRRAVDLHCPSPQLFKDIMDELEKEGAFVVKETRPSLKIKKVKDD